GEEDAARVIAYLRTRARGEEFVFFAPGSWAQIRDIGRFRRHAADSIGLDFPAAYLEGSIAIHPSVGNMSKIQHCMKGATPKTIDAGFFLSFWESHFKCRLRDETLPVCDPSVGKRTAPCQCYGNESLWDPGSVNLGLNYVYDSVQFVAVALDKIIYRCTDLRTKNFCGLKTVTSYDLLLAVREISYRGETGPIQFSGAPFRRKSTFDIFQYDREGRLRRVGEWDVDGTNILRDNLRFKTGSVPESEIIPDTTNVLRGNMIVVSLFAVNILVVFLLVAIAFFFVYHKDTGVVRRASLSYLVVVDAGLVFVTVSALLWSVGPSSLNCIVKAWFALVGLGMVAAGMCSKAHHALRYYITLGTISSRTPSRSIFLYLAFLCAGEHVLWALYCFAGSTLRLVSAQSVADNTYQYCACQKETPSQDTLLLVLVFAFNIVLFVAPMLVYAFSANLVMPEGESKMSFFMLINMAMVFLLLTPIYLLNDDRKGSLVRGWLIRTVGMFSFVAFTVLVLFVPKIKYIYKEREEGDKEVLDPEAEHVHRRTFGKPGFVSWRVESFEGSH
ncbi:MAG: uncharacterized protein A8A55_3003, partial [Amphiamblys sp. WSBS2006]